MSSPIYEPWVCQCHTSVRRPPADLTQYGGGSSYFRRREMPPPYCSCRLGAPGAPSLPSCSCFPVATKAAGGRGVQNWDVGAAVFDWRSLMVSAMHIPISSLSCCCACLGGSSHKINIGVETGAFRSPWRYVPVLGSIPCRSVLGSSHWGFPSHHVTPQPPGPLTGT